MTLEALRTSLKSARSSIVLAIFAAVLVLTLALVGWHQNATKRGTERLNAFGETLAEQLAELIVEPLLSDDRIRLHMLANRMAEFDAVEGISVFTVDNQLISVAGRSTTNPQLPTFTKGVTVQDTIAGYVRVAIEPDAFVSSFADKVWRSLPWSIAAVVFAGLLGYVMSLDRRFMGQAAGIALTGSRRAQQSRSTTSSMDVVAGPASAYILVINIFNQISLPSTYRSEVLAQATQFAGRVTNLYAARAFPLSGTGAAIAFDKTDTEDRAFEVVCACLLLRKALSSLNRDHYANEHPEIRFRFGLHEAPVENRNALLESEQMADAVLLSALAPDNNLAASDEVMREVERPERVEGTSTTNPAAAALATASDEYHLIESVGSTYQSLIERQAELIVAQT